jgi:hypothetical protein
MWDVGLTYMLQVCNGIGASEGEKGFLWRSQHFPRGSGEQVQAARSSEPQSPLHCLPSVNI